MKLATVLHTPLPPLLEKTPGQNPRTSSTSSASFPFHLHVKKKETGKGPTTRARVRVWKHIGSVGSRGSGASAATPRFGSFPCAPTAGHSQPVSYVVSHVNK